MLPSNIIALVALIAAPMFAVAYPASHSSEELNLRALADEHSITARQIAEAMVDILERSFDEGDMVRRAPPNGDCSSGVPQAGMTGPACANAHGHGWKSGGRCYSRQQMALQGNIIRGLCYF